VNEKEKKNEKDIRLFLFIFFIQSAVGHSVLATYFFTQQFTVLAVLNILDVLFFLIAIRISKSIEIRFISYLFALKIVQFSFISTILMGLNINTQWLLLMAMFLIALHLDFTRMQRIVIFVSLPLAMNIQLIIPEIFPPPFYIERDFFLSFFYANIVVFSFSIGGLMKYFLSNKITASFEKDVAEYKQIANIDPLTKLNNRRFAESFFAKLDGISCLVGLMDIDNFKAVNDTYGHDIGDIVLAHVADVLRNTTRQTDLVCRWGGEEFLVGFPECTPEDGLKILESIRKGVEDRIIDTEKGQIKVTLTLGASIFFGGNVKDTLELCDMLLYDGKKAGKNIVMSKFDNSYHDLQLSWRS